MSERGTKRTADMMSEDSQSITEYLESELDILPPLSVLGVALKPGISIITDSPNRDSFGSIYSFTEIGYGSTSCIIHKPEEPFVVKKLHPCFSRANDLVTRAAKEAKMAMEVFQVFDTYEPESNIRINVPGNAKALDNWERFWHSAGNLPHLLRVPTPAIQMDTIFSLPKAVGRALIQQYYPRRAGSNMDPYVVEEILNQPDNQHCLVQPCLGLDTCPREPGGFKLRNFELSLTDMHRIGLNTVDLSRAIGEAFALLHYRCGLSGTDVSFAFGTSRSKLCILYTVDLYLFDFGGCWKIDNSRAADEQDLNIADVMLNPGVRKFIPSPQKSPTLYKNFKDAYVKQAKKVLDNENNPTPHNVMKHYERLAARQLW
ncbi:hypothetical protein BHE90_006259 [Fusarium euwallaceae]|uniref:DUF3669 domain-containing protein n=2 Tax=Fusarium solani species complex TaxID=232080 RepID=A0A3M2SDR6_9HYPO|nr:hypothetical protein CDV36_004638 [Fusarium kuroshium]RTE79243.1 hypothetical protein BHE90_006259 [Fusarium euwallaceae]